MQSGAEPFKTHYTIRGDITALLKVQRITYIDLWLWKRCPLHYSGLTESCHHKNKPTDAKTYGAFQDKWVEKEGYRVEARQGETATKRRPIQANQYVALHSRES